MIRLYSVSKTLGRGRFKKSVLEDINWVIPESTRFVILGQRGAGKSTLLHLISGLVIPTNGWIERRGTISVAGGLLRYGRFGSARQLIHRLADMYQVEARQADVFVARLAELGSLMDVPVRHLPKSFKKKLNLALTYAFPFDVYLFDGAINFGESPDIRARIKEVHDLRTRHASVVVATSSTALAREFSHGAIAGVLHKSRLLFFQEFEDAIAVFQDLPPPPKSDFVTHFDEEEVPEVDDLGF